MRPIVKLDSDETKLLRSAPLDTKNEVYAIQPKNCGF